VLKIAELVLKLGLDALEIVLGIPGDLASLPCAHEPFLFGSAVDFVSVLDHVFTSLQLLLGFRHFTFLLHVGQNLFHDWVKLVDDGRINWLHELVLYRESIYV